MRVKEGMCVDVDVKVGVSVGVGVDVGPPVLTLEERSTSTQRQKGRTGSVSRQVDDRGGGKTGQGRGGDREDTLNLELARAAAEARASSRMDCGSG